MNLYDLLDRNARVRPDHLAVVGARPLRRLTYRELNDAVRAVGAALAEAGMRPGDGVGLHYTSGADYIVLTYAVWSRGGCVVPIPPELAPCEKQEICRDIALRFVISEPERSAFAEPFLRGRRGRGVELVPGATLVPVASPREAPAGLAGINAAFIRFT